MSVDVVSSSSSSLLQQQEHRPTLWRFVSAAEIIKNLEGAEDDEYQSEEDRKISGDTGSINSTGCISSVGVMSGGSTLNPLSLEESFGQVKLEKEVFQSDSSSDSEYVVSESGTSESDSESSSASEAQAVYKSKKKTTTTATVSDPAMMTMTKKQPRIPKGVQRENPNLDHYVAARTQNVGAYGPIKTPLRIRFRYKWYRRDIMEKSAAIHATLLYVEDKRTPVIIDDDPNLTDDIRGHVFTSLSHAALLIRPISQNGWISWFAYVDDGKGTFILETLDSLRHRSFKNTMPKPIISRTTPTNVGLLQTDKKDLLMSYTIKDGKTVGYKDPKKPTTVTSTVKTAKAVKKTTKDTAKTVKETAKDTAKTTTKRQKVVSQQHPQAQPQSQLQKASSMSKPPPPFPFNPFPYAGQDLPEQWNAKHTFLLLATRVISYWGIKSIDSFMVRLPDGNEIMAREILLPTDNTCNIRVTLAIILSRTQLIRNLIVKDTPIPTTPDVSMETLLEHNALPYVFRKLFLDRDTITAFEISEDITTTDMIHFVSASIHCTPDVCKQKIVEEANLFSIEGLDIIDKP